MSIESYASQGFAMAICVYLLVRFEKKMEENTKALHSLEVYIKAHS